MPIQRNRSGRMLAAAGALTLLAGFAIAPQELAAAPLDSGNGNGNGGTVKIDELDLDNGPGEGPGNDNDPQLAGCAGQVEWYGFDTGTLAATVTFTVWAPTAANTAPEAETELVLEQVVHDGDGPGVPNDAAALDAVLPFDLSALLAPFTAQPEQGYHVKVVVETPGSQGNDTKSKVFWVPECETEPTTTTSSTTTSSTTTTTTAATTSTSDVLGTTVTQAPTSAAPTTLPTEVLGVQLARTGLSEMVLAVGFASLGLGLLMELVARSVNRRNVAS